MSQDSDDYIPTSWKRSRKNGGHPDEKPPDPISNVFSSSFTYGLAESKKNKLQPSQPQVQLKKPSKLKVSHQQPRPQLQPQLLSAPVHHNKENDGPGSYADFLKQNRGKPVSIRKNKKILETETPASTAPDGSSIKLSSTEVPLQAQPTMIGDENISDKDVKSLLEGGCKETQIEKLCDICKTYPLDVVLAYRSQVLKSWNVKPENVTAKDAADAVIVVLELFDKCEPDDVKKFMELCQQTNVSDDAVSDDAVSDDAFRFLHETINDGKTTPEALQDTLKYFAEKSSTNSPLATGTGEGSTEKNAMPTTAQDPPVYIGTVPSTDNPTMAKDPPLPDDHKVVASRPFWDCWPVAEPFSKDEDVDAEMVRNLSFMQPYQCKVSMKSFSSFRGPEGLRDTEFVAPASPPRHPIQDKVQSKQSSPPKAQAGDSGFNTWNCQITSCEQKGNLPGKACTKCGASSWGHRQQIVQSFGMQKCKKCSVPLTGNKCESCEHVNPNATGGGAKEPSNLASTSGKIGKGGFHYIPSKGPSLLMAQSVAKSATVASAVTKRVENLKAPPTIEAASAVRNLPAMEGSTENDDSGSVASAVTKRVENLKAPPTIKAASAVKNPPVMEGSTEKSPSSTVQVAEEDSEEQAVSIDDPDKEDKQRLAKCYGRSKVGDYWGVFKCLLDKHNKNFYLALKDFSILFPLPTGAVLSDSSAQSVKKSSKMNGIEGDSAVKNPPMPTEESTEKPEEASAIIKLPIRIHDSWKKKPPATLVTTPPAGVRRVRTLNSFALQVELSDHEKKPLCRPDQEVYMTAVALARQKKYSVVYKWYQPHNVKRYSGSQDSFTKHIKEWEVRHVDTWNLVGAVSDGNGWKLAVCPSKVVLLRVSGQGENQERVIDLSVERMYHEFMDYLKNVDDTEVTLKTIHNAGASVQKKNKCWLGGRGVMELLYEPHESSDDGIPEIEGGSGNTSRALVGPPKLQNNAVGFPLVGPDHPSLNRIVDAQERLEMEEKAKDERLRMAESARQEREKFLEQQNKANAEVVKLLTGTVTKQNDEIASLRSDKEALAYKAAKAEGKAEAMTDDFATTVGDVVTKSLRKPGRENSNIQYINNDPIDHIVNSGETSPQRPPTRQVNRVLFPEEMASAKDSSTEEEKEEKPAPSENAAATDDKDGDETEAQDEEAVVPDDTVPEISGFINLNEYPQSGALLQNGNLCPKCSNGKYNHNLCGTHNNKLKREIAKHCNNCTAKELCHAHKAMYENFMHSRYPS